MRDLALEVFSSGFNGLLAMPGWNTCPAPLRPGFLVATVLFTCRTIEQKVNRYNLQSSYSGMHARNEL